MKSKEIIQRLIAHKEPPRIGYDFQSNTDIMFVESRRYINLPDNPYEMWGDYQELKALTGFSGEVRRDMFGSIYGRFRGKTLGECIRGVIENWEDFTYPIPEFDRNFRNNLLSQNYAEHDKFVVTQGRNLFSSLCKARLMPNAMADIIIEPEAVSAFVNRIADHEIEVIKSIAGCGIDGWMLLDDWGIQDRTLVSPNAFRELFKPAYARIADALHEAGISFILHSCGYNYTFMEDMLDMGVDVFQFDQPDAYPAEVLASEFADRAVFYSPVDIQKVMPTGDREFIEHRAKEMCDMFRKAGDGWIAKDYLGYEDIGVEPEWAQWAREVILANSTL